jgi:hypothetical protein
MSVASWKPIPGYSLFEACGDGRIRRVAYPLFTKGPRHPLPHVLRGWKSATGYLNVNIPKDDGGYGAIRVHRLVLLAFQGSPPEGRDLGCHRDGNRLNNRADNLYWGSHKDNGSDRVRLGEQVCWRLQPNGHPTAKLTEHNVRSIKRRLGEGERVCDVADSYGVARTTISMIKSGKNWAWVAA